MCTTMKCTLTIVAICLIFAQGGCAKPDKIVKIDSPTEGLYLTLETFGGKDGPLSSDGTWVYVHLDRNGKSDRKAVLYGNYLSFAQAKWISPTSASLCLNKGGLISEYHNEANLSIDGVSAKVHVYLSEQC